ncbi:alkaline phosphatase [Novosphingobium sp. Gsoil 351]|uniref:alkaline phosphatase D family protein n=1 Tax=Novosphingobium sp. Gsoil 351 TaxID=2675225 RepID=UPI0012B46DD4|nr:alkaline phosphatase D family protein [Novosphingobium sp. Gsoil 351]QGN55388.1 alkaline phosphatase [Novosphingobium sp. Gsoil 351]
MATPLPLLPPAFDRRAFVRAGIVGIGLLALPGMALAAGVDDFTHGVASGEPGADRVLLWTRYVGTGDDAVLRFEVADSLDFAKPVTGGEVRALADRDWCAKVVATGLQPGRWYYYRFVEPGGAISPVGRTRTLPVGKVDRFRMAVFSCSNLGFGWFNAYAHAAEDGAFDAVVHLGDYYYEYQKGEYPGLDQIVPGRVLLPEKEIVSLADYRLRHANYRADPDLQRLFQLQPWIMVWDDHETANDSWKDGAENHQPATEGPWPLREAAAMRAYHEWLPVSDETWAAYEIGELATLFRLETRLTARDEQFDLSAIERGSDAEIAAALAKFRDGEWRDSARTLMGAKQEAWLADGLRESRRAGKPWQVLAQQIVMGKLLLPTNVADGMRPDSREELRSRILGRIAATKAGLPFNMDAWDGYPAARERLLASARAADANLVVLSGDSHNAWANDLALGKAAAGVEFAGTSVTSPGAEGSLPWMNPDRLASDLVALNPGLKWCDTAQRGYMAIELTPARSTCEWRFIDTVHQRSTKLAPSHTMSVEAGRNRFA